MDPELAGPPAVRRARDGDAKANVRIEGRLVEEARGQHYIVLLGGSNPGERMHPVAADAMAEVGIDIADEYPQPWTDENPRGSRRGRDHGLR